MIFGMYKKRLTAIALSLVMTAGTAAAAVFADSTAAAEDAETEAAAVREATAKEQTAEKLLSMLDIIRGNDKFSPETEITRGYFTALVSRALMTTGDGTEIRTMFRDVAEDYKWADEIAGMYRAGYVSGDNDRKFSPEDKITVYEAATIAVSGLGYRQQAMLKGGWPTGYITEAKRLKITSGKSGEETLTCSEAALMVLNMLEADAAIPTGVDDMGGTVYSVSKDLLSRRYDVYTIEGIVTENGITGLYSDAAEENAISVDGLRIKNTKNEDLSELLGLSVKLYCRESNGDYEYMLLKDSSRSTVQSLNGWDNGVRYDRSGNSVSYDDGSGKDKTVRLSGDFKFIYNGKAEDNYLKYTADLSESTVRIIENSGDSMYDVLIVETYNTLVADAAGSTSTSVVSKYTGFPILKPEDYHRADFTDMQGSTLTVPDIARGDVISWYASADMSYAKIVKSSLTVTGKVSGTVSDEYVIEGKRYKAAPTVTKGAVPVKIGDKGTFSLDIFGRIAEFSKDFDSSEGFGLLIAHKKKSELDGTVQAKILNEVHELRTYTLADRVRINGKSVKKNDLDAAMTTAEAANDEGGTKKEDVIKFKTNDNGDITSIDFALDTIPAKENAVDGTLYKYKKKANRPYKEGTGNMNDDFIIDKSKTVVLGIDTNFEYGSDDRYFVMSGSQFGNDAWITAEAYTTKKEPDKAEAIVYYGVPASNEMKFFAINTIGETLNSDNETVYTASGFTQSGSRDAIIDSELVEKLGLTDGDIIGGSSKVDAKGTLYDAELLYDYSEKKMLKNLVGDGYFFHNRAFMLYPYSYSGNVIKWFMATSRDGAAEQYAKEGITEDELRNTLVPSGAIYVADGSRGDIYKKGSMADIVSYVQNPGEFSDIIVNSKWGNTQFIVVINR